ncbi:hypothetical protein Hanom_Chr05g00453011 [Helianthus anomalus]
MELEAGSKLATNSKYQGGKWLFLNYLSKTVKMTKPQGAKRKFTLNINQQKSSRSTASFQSVLVQLITLSVRFRYLV